ncbi:hypothetical protein CPB85DRAFT_1562587 [Mucidula mucida]|nr:hypothetical protein CPB85DRAFT_1562587 [Mucidula mucida]
MKPKCVTTPLSGALSHILALVDDSDSNVPGIVTRASRVWKATGPETDTSTGYYKNLVPNSEAGEEVNNPFHSPTSFREVYHLAEGTSHEPQPVIGRTSALSNDSGMSRRSIFHGVGKSLYGIRDYADFTSALAQLVQGLESIHLAGFVHLNISPGNCLLYEGQLKISDLEYARKYISQGENITPLTPGTPGFMAVEYQRGQYMFQTGGGCKANLDLYSRKTPSTLHFQFNFLHDLESVIWIYLWLLLETVPGSFTKIEEDAHRDDILRLRHKLFDGSLEGSGDRFGFIHSLSQDDNIRFDEVWDTLSPIYGDDSALLIGLNSFLHLANCYAEVESLPRQSALPGSMNWAPTCFVHRYYAELCALFLHIHERVKTTIYERFSIHRE